MATKVYKENLKAWEKVTQRKFPLSEYKDSNQLNEEGRLTIKQ